MDLLLLILLLYVIYHVFNRHARTTYTREISKGFPPTGRVTYNPPPEGAVRPEPPPPPPPPPHRR